MEVKELIESGETLLGIELGSTRIKAQLIGSNGTPIAAGNFDWENDLENGIWTYSLDKITEGLRECYKSLASDVKKKYGVTLNSIGGIGISAMMHGYVVLDKEDKLLVPFRTWRNSITADAADKLTELFDFNVPQRWSIAHLFQAILNKEDHVKDIAYITTLAGYIHYRLTGTKVLGVGDASGMFPIDSDYMNYNKSMLSKFCALDEVKKYPWELEAILPKVLTAGEEAGMLTEAGAKFLDESGTLKAGILLCPPEGDAGTGMVATNSVAVRTCNISAGTSVFAMVVLEKALSKVYREIDMVTTPTGHTVAMVHANNCTSDLNAWVNIFKEYTESMGIKSDINTIYGILYRKALEGDRNCGELLSYGYLSGENITGLEEGRPLFVRMPDSRFTLANFMRANLYTSIAALKIGMDILMKEEKVEIDTILGHGGLFKTKGVGQNFLAAALDTKVTVMETAGEGGPWGMALLASYMVHKKDGQTLESFLTKEIFGAEAGYTVQPDPLDAKGFEEYIDRYKKGLPVEKAAVDSL